MTTEKDDDDWKEFEDAINRPRVPSNNLAPLTEEEARQLDIDLQSLVTGLEDDENDGPAIAREKLAVQLENVLPLAKEVDDPVVSCLITGTLARLREKHDW